ncbi:hypothetical protein BJ508DRAFT_330256 [Ascobolus immersus RN42]|uniref:Uncharacterized protein n=1 Tax=Ascobolus immersus RN42 TaxID=1160509 RepID=A0A3N4HY20_ASCIM|nr:hypothetical protein BJ508DRAFT_330256 [Ascobolus immersus RN42]
MAGRNRRMLPASSENPFAICNHFDFPSPVLCDECIDAIQARAQFDDDEQRKPSKIPRWLKPVIAQWNRVELTNILLVVLFAFAVMVILIPTYYHTAVAIRNAKAASRQGKAQHARRSMPTTGKETEDPQLYDCKAVTERMTIFITHFRNVTGSTVTVTVSESHTTNLTATAPPAADPTDPSTLPSKNSTQRRQQAATHMTQLGPNGPSREQQTDQQPGHPDYNIADMPAKVSQSQINAEASTSPALNDDKLRSKSSG